MNVINTLAHISQVVIPTGHFSYYNVWSMQP